MPFLMRLFSPQSITILILYREMIQEMIKFAV